MPFTQELPEWKATGTKPPQSKLDTGWQIGERPPSGWWNWLLNRTYLAVQELQQEAINVDQKGVAGGVASLGADGKVPASQLNVSSPPDASTTVKGIVMLEDSVTSVSTSKAATPNSVKTVSDALSGHTSNANIHVTTGDKANWNSKETTTGAQAKADAAQAAANTYTDSKTANLIPVTQKGQPSGVATLGTDGKVPATQLPTIASTANDITIADANDYYMSTKVEGALQEIGQTLAGTRASIVTTAQQLGVM